MIHEERHCWKPAQSRHAESLPRDQVVGNLLSLYSSYLAPQAQHVPSAHDETMIPALKNIQDDKPKKKEEQPLPSLFDSGILQPF